MTATSNEGAGGGEGWICVTRSLMLCLLHGSCFDKKELTSSVEPWLVAKIRPDQADLQHPRPSNGGRD